MKKNHQSRPFKTVKNDPRRRHKTGYRIRISTSSLICSVMKTDGRYSAWSREQDFKHFSHKQSVSEWKEGGMSLQHIWCLFVQQNITQIILIKVQIVVKHSSRNFHKSAGLPYLAWHDSNKTNGVAKGRKKKKGKKRNYFISFLKGSPFEMTCQLISIQTTLALCCKAVDGNYSSETFTFTANFFQPCQNHGCWKDVTRFQGQSTVLCQGKDKNQGNLIWLELG